MGFIDWSVIDWSPLGNVSKYINNGRVPNGVVEDRRFLTRILMV